MICCIASGAIQQGDNNDEPGDRRASLDVLDGLEDRDDASVVLVPKVMTATEIQEQKKQAQAIADIAQVWSLIIILFTTLRVKNNNGSIVTRVRARFCSFP